MPLAATKKASVFMTADYSEIAVPFLRSAFAQRLIIGTPCAVGALLPGTNPLVISGFGEFEDLADWQFMTRYDSESFRGLRKFSDI